MPFPKVVLVLGFFCVGLFASKAVYAEPRFIPIPVPDGATNFVARGLSADGLTVVGDIDNEAFYWTESIGIVRLGLGPAGSTASVAHAASANGSVVVGTFVDANGREQPFRWTAAAGIEPLVATPGDRDTGFALDVTADGQTIVGGYGAIPSIDDCGAVICPISNTGSITAFSWSAGTGMQSLGTFDNADGSVATAVSADGSRIVGSNYDYTDFMYPVQQCAAPTSVDCNLSRVIKSTFDYTSGVLSAPPIRSGNVTVGISADGQTIVGSNDLNWPFTYATAQGVQQLSFNGVVARDINADGSVVVGDFGVLLEDRDIVLSNFLSSGLRLPVAGWRLDSTDSLSQFIENLIAPGFISGSPGLLATADDALTLLGMGEDPLGSYQPFLVKLDQLPTAAELNAIPPFAAGNFASSAIVSAALPHSRTATLGQTVTFAATVINATDKSVSGCSVSTFSDLPLTLTYQPLASANDPMGMLNVPFDLAPNGSESLLLAVTPGAEFEPSQLNLYYDCGNTSPANQITDLNDVLVAASSVPLVDVVALSATQSADGIVRLGDSGTGAFAVATVNVSDATDTITVSAFARLDSETTTVSLCETDTATGQCLAEPGEFLTVTMAPDQTRSYGVFVSSTIDQDPEFDRRRIVINFTDGASNVRGRTSVAVVSSRFL